MNRLLNAETALLVGAVGTIALLDGGATQLVGHTIAGVCAYKAHEYIAGQRLDRTLTEMDSALAALTAELEADADPAKQLKHTSLQSRKDQIQMDRNGMKVASAAIGLGTFVAPGLGIAVAVGMGAAHMIAGQREAAFLRDSIQDAEEATEPEQETASA